MNRRREGKKGTRRSSRAASPETADSDAVAFDSMDWDSTSPVELDLDPALLEAIRSRGRLKSLTLRVGAEQIIEARRIAKETGLKYQAVLRRWLAEGASRSRRSRGRSEHAD